jgi:hypothetical protein
MIVCSNFSHVTWIHCHRCSIKLKSIVIELSTVMQKPTMGEINFLFSPLWLLHGNFERSPCVNKNAGACVSVRGCVRCEGSSSLGVDAVAFGVLPRKAHSHRAPQGPSRPASAAGRELKQGIRRRRIKFIWKRERERERERERRESAARPACDHRRKDPTPLFLSFAASYFVRACNSFSLFLYVYGQAFLTIMLNHGSARKANKLTCGLGFF